MNSPTHYIVYGSDEAIRGNDPVNCYTCHSASQALAVAYKLKVDPATHVFCNMGDKHTIFFHHLDTLCGDILRSHSVIFMMKLDDYSGNQPVPCTPSIMTRAQVLSWVLSHADELDMMTYVFDYKTNLGRYVLGNLAESYIIQELPTE